MRPDREMAAWGQDPPSRRMPWSLLAFVALASGIIVAMVVR
jgi:hypothetical protein